MSLSYQDGKTLKYDKPEDLLLNQYSIRLLSGLKAAMILHRRHGSPGVDIFHKPIDYLYESHHNYFSIAKSKVAISRFHGRGQHHGDRNHGG